MVIGGKMENLSYWIFTSGEKGIHELDWGIKFASPLMDKASVLDIRYRALLKEFALMPNLIRPEDNNAGLLLLPGENNTALLGFVFAGVDHKQRPNTSALVCVIPENLRKTMQVNEIVELLSKCNDLERIAQINSVERPDFLRLDEISAEKEKIFQYDINLVWPGETDCYLCINGEFLHFTRPAPQKKSLDLNSNKKKLMIVTVLGLLAVVGIVLYSLTGKTTVDVSNYLATNVISPDIKVKTETSELTVATATLPKNMENPQVLGLKKSDDSDKTEEIVLRNSHEQLREQDFSALENFDTVNQSPKSNGFFLAVSFFISSLTATIKSSLFLPDNS